MINYNFKESKVGVLKRNPVGVLFLFRAVDIKFPFFKMFSAKNVTNLKRKLKKNVYLEGEYIYCKLFRMPISYLNFLCLYLKQNCTELYNGS